MENDVSSSSEMAPAADDGSAVIGQEALASPEDSLLHAARHGNLRVVDEMLACRREAVFNLDLNCRGLISL